MYETSQLPNLVITDNYDCSNEESLPSKKEMKLAYKSWDGSFSGFENMVL